jgi:HAD superfamily hydrolase (TIGR01509 family)
MADTLTQRRVAAAESRDIPAAVDAFLRQHDYPAFTPKAVLFDMDGVLFDSMPNHARSWARVCTEFGIEMSPEEAYLHEGRTGESTINLLMQRYFHRDATAEEYENIYEEKCRAFNDCPPAGKMPGAEEVLLRVQQKGLKILVVTGSGQQSLLERLETGFPGFFSLDRTVSSKDVKHGKPSPEPYLMGLEKAGVRPWEAIVVENAPLGVHSAVAAGIFTIAVNTGPLPDNVLLDEGAHLLYPSMAALATSPIFM